MSVGLALAKRIYKEQWNDQALSCYAGRKLKWRENRLWAKGMQDMKEFLDFLSISGVKAYTNVDTTAPKLGHKFVKVLVNSMMNNEEYPCVKAVDDGSKEEKTREKQDALYRMHDVQNVNEMQEAAGMSLEAPDAYVPDSESAADVYFEEEFKMQEEAEYEEGLGTVQSDSNHQMCKRLLLKDGIVVNLLATKIERAPNGKPIYRNCIPEALIYNYFHNENGKLQLSYIGEVYSLKVKDLRVKWGSHLTEEKFFELCKGVTQTNVATTWVWGWQNEYATNSERPYDDYNIEVFDFEIMMADADYYTSKTDNYGGTDIQAKRGIPQPTSDKVTVMKKAKNSVLRGVYCIRSEKMLYWGAPEIVIRPYQDIEQALFSYSINIPGNDGEYVPSLFEGAVEPLREWTLCKLKRKQLIANLRAAGVAIDVARTRNIDMGGGDIEPTEVVTIYNQTGNVLWSSESANPNEQSNVPPITEMPNAGSIAQLNELSNIIERCEAEIRGLLGVPLSRDGSDMPPRMGVGVVDTQLASSNNVTDDVYKGYLAVMQETLHKICMLQWDDDAIVKGDEKKINKKFQVDVKMLPTQYEKQMLEQQLAISLKEGYISQSTAIRVRNIKNFKVAWMYLGEQEEKAKQQQMAQAQQQSEMNAKTQQETQQLAAQIKQQEAEFQAMVEEKKQDAIGKQKKEEVLLSTIMTMFSTGIPIPAQLSALADAVLKNVAMPLVSENDDMLKAMQAKQEQDVAAQQAAAEEQMVQQPPMAA